MKKRFCLAGIALLLLLLAVCGWKGYCAYYPVEEDLENLPHYVNHALNRGNKNQFDYQIRLYDSAAVGNERYVLVEIDRQLGFVRLERGLNDRYRVAGIGYGGGNFREAVVESEGEKALLFAGRNAVWGIAEAEFSLDRKMYRLEIPVGERFLLKADLPSETRESHIDLESVRFYAADGKDITENIPWN